MSPAGAAARPLSGIAVEAMDADEAAAGRFVVTNEEEVERIQARLGK